MTGLAITSACPFCGEADDLSFHDDVETGRRLVGCNWCDARGPQAPPSLEAAELWNKRSEPEKEDE